MQNQSMTESDFIRVGIDFGTTHTIVSLADQGNYPILSLPFEYDGEILATDLTPSCITRHEGRTWYGPAALQYFRENYDHGAVLIPSIKRALRDWYKGRTITVGNEEIPVEDLLIGFLSEIRRAVLMALDLDVAEVEAVIAVPANASSSQRFVTLHCFRKAGFRVSRILDEPVASAIQYVRERYKRWDRVRSDVVIYDLGGGTFDTTMLAIDHGAYDPVLSMGIGRLGGDDFDHTLLELVEKQAGCKFEDRERLEMLQVVRGVKESIGPYTRKLHVDTRDGVVSIPVKDFQDAILPLMQRTIDMVDRVLAETTGRAEPDRIVLVGGGSLLASVPIMLRKQYGRHKIHQGLYPFASVAIGAAIQAGEPDLKVLDRLNNHFGVIRVRMDGSEYIDVIFEKNRRLPAVGIPDVVAKPVYDPRFNIGRFQYLECSDVDPVGPLPAGDTIYWNEVLFPYDQALNPGGADPPLIPDNIEPADHLKGERIIEEYTLDEFGIVTARISRTVQDNFSGCYNLYKREW